MRVLQVITDTDRRGAQIFASDLGAALGRLGHVVETVALAPGTTAPPLDVTTLGPTRLGRRTLRALRARARDVEVIAAHGSSTLPACAIATFGLPTPFVYRQISESLFWAPDRWRRWRVRTYLSRASRVVSLSSTQAEVLVQHFGVKRSRLDVVPNGVPGAAFHPADDAASASARQRLGVPADAFVVLSISALVPEKGVDRVIEAVAELPARGEAANDPWLIVAGAGEARGALEQQAHVALGERAVFTGSLDDPASAYAAADVAVLASRGGDSMPATLVEAALCGVPSIATPVGAITDVVIDGETGLVVPVAASNTVLARAIGSLAGDAARRRALGEQARAHCLAHFEIEVVARRWHDALTAAVAG
jgi:glycosyltransferase involved in cell wall biosynthesis